MPKMLQNNKKINFAELSKEFLDQLQKGAFLTVKSGTQVNMMTIAWGSLGFMWNKPMFTAMVRYQDTPMIFWKMHYARKSRRTPMVLETIMSCIMEKS
jgi:hypothetical protein